jgi:leucyl-tRNA synthetase
VIVRTGETEIADLTAAMTEKGVLVNSGNFNGLTSEQAFNDIAAFLTAQNKGQRRVNYRLRDWGVSRQRYWGCPIPMIECPHCGTVPVPEKDLPVILPEEVQMAEVGSPLKQDPNFYTVKCPQCGADAKRETDTFDTFMESSWYYARFSSPDCDSAMLDKEKVNYWLPVDQYIGGIEHAILHLLYARFYHRLLRDEGLVQGNEPFKRLLTQGMVIAETFYRDGKNGKNDWINPADVDIERDAKGRVVGAKLKTDGLAVNIGNTEKMSKSKNNGVDPQIMIERYGADTVRLFMMFAAPPEQSLEWSDAGVEGSARFLKRLWRQVVTQIELETPALDVNALGKAEKEVRRQVHEAIVKIGDDIGRRYTFNTAIAAAMELINTLGRAEDSPQMRAVIKEGLEAVVLMLSPIVPHITQALWEILGHDGLVMQQAWLKAAPAALTRDSVEVVVQVNGKLRAHLQVASDLDSATIEQLALNDPHVQRFLEGKTVKKVVVVKGKLVNVVVA